MLLRFSGLGIFMIRLGDIYDFMTPSRAKISSTRDLTRINAADVTEISAEVGRGLMGYRLKKEIRESLRLLLSRVPDTPHFKSA